MKEHKTQRKQAEHQSVFLRFGDKQGRRRAGNHYSQTKRSWYIYASIHITIHKRSPAIEILIGGSEGKVADGIGQSALPAPRNRDAVGVAERSGSGDANAQRVGGLVVLQAKVADGSGAKGRGDLRHAVSIGRQRIVSCCIVSGGSAGGEELSAGGSSEGIKRSLAGKVIGVD